MDSLLGKRVRKWLLSHLSCLAQPSSSPALVPDFVQLLGSLPPFFSLLQRSVVRWKPRKVGPHIINIWRRGLKLVMQITITKMQNTSFDRSFSVRGPSPEKKLVAAFSLRIWPLWGKCLAHRDPRARGVETGLQYWQSGAIQGPWRQTAVKDFLETRRSQHCNV